MVVSLWCFISTLVHSILSIIKFSVQLQPLFNLTLYCSTIYCNQWCSYFSFNCLSIIFFYYHTCLVVSGLALSFDDPSVVLKLCFLNLVATKLTLLELHKIIFGVSRIILIVGFQRLLNPLSTKHKVNLWKNVLELIFSNLCIL